MEQEKDNFWLYVGGLIVGVVVLVVLFKGMKTDDISTQHKAYAETDKQVSSQIERQHTMKND